MSCHDTVTFHDRVHSRPHIHAQHDAAVLSRLTYRTESERAPSGLVLRSDTFLELEGGSFPRRNASGCQIDVELRWASVWDPGRAAAQTDCAAEAADRGGVLSFLVAWLGQVEQARSRALPPLSIAPATASDLRCDNKYGASGELVYFRSEVHIHKCPNNWSDECFVPTAGFWYGPDEQINQTYMSVFLVFYYLYTWSTGRLCYVFCSWLHWILFHAKTAELCELNLIFCLPHEIKFSSYNSHFLQSRRKWLNN